MDEHKNGRLILMTNLHIMKASLHALDLEGNISRIWDREIQPN
jgi:hypothetical protein